MRLRKALTLFAVVAMLFSILGVNSTLLAENEGKVLSVKHQITTTGLPLVGPVVVNNTQEFQGTELCRSVRTSQITMNDSVISDVVVVNITDLKNNEQYYINPKTKVYAVSKFDPATFPVIDEAADAKGPQMTIKETGETKEINGLKCRELYFKLDLSSSTGVGDAKVKQYFEGTMWITKDIPNGEIYSEYNSNAHDYLRGSGYSAGGFYDILSRLDVDQYNLVRLIKAMEGIPVEASFVAQLSSEGGGNVFQTTIKLIEYSDKPFPKDNFKPPADYEKIPVQDFRSF